MQSISLKSIEKKIWLSTFQDGIWDIYWGTLLLGFGMSSLLKYFGLSKPLNFIIFPLLAFAILILGKKFITVPRLGMVVFGKKRKRDSKLLFFLGVITFVIVTSLFFFIKSTPVGLAGTNELSGYAGPIGFALFFIFVISIIAYFMQFNRLYFYSFLFGTSIPLTELLYKIIGEPLDSIIAFSAASLPIFVIGFSLFFKFISQYKKQSEE